MPKFIALWAVAIVAIAITPSAAGAAASPAPVQTVQIDVQHVIVAVGAPISLRATLKSDGTAFAGAPIHFAIDGAVAGATVKTDSSGFAQNVIPFPSGLAVGQHVIRVEFSGDAGHKAAALTGDLSVLKSATAIGGSFQTVGTPVGSPTQWREEVSGTLVRTTDQAGIAGMLAIILDGQPVGNVPTDAKGVFGFKVAVKKPSGVYSIRLEFAGNSQYSPTSVESPVLVDGPKTIVYYMSPQVIVSGGKFETGRDVTITTKLTTGPGGGGSPVHGAHLLICLPVLQDPGVASKYGGCDDATTDLAGVATKYTTLQVAGLNQARLDLNPDAIRYTDGSHQVSNFHVARSATKIDATINGKTPTQLDSPGNYTLEATISVIATGKPAKCVSVSLFLQPPGFGWDRVDEESSCDGKPIPLHIGLADGWNPGDWKLKISLDANDGFGHSEAIYPFHVVAVKIKAPNLPNPAR
jgi:hypothetical protein